SLLLVFIVILLSVAQSFWNSLYDYHLNDPTRSEKMIEAHIDVETYVDNHFYLESQLDDLASNARDDAETIKALSKEIEDYQNELTSDKEMKEKVDKIDELLTNYEPGGDSDLKYQKIDSVFAEDYREVLLSYESDLNSLAKSTSDAELQSDFQQVVDLLGSTCERILES